MIGIEKSILDFSNPWESRAEPLSKTCKTLVIKQKIKHIKRIQIRPLRSDHESGFCFAYFFLINFQ
jgi:hypothetical protein